MIQNLPKKVQMCNPHTIKQAGIYSNMESILNHCKHRAVRNKPRRTAWRFQLIQHVFQQIYHAICRLDGGDYDLLILTVQICPAHSYKSEKRK